MDSHVFELIDPPSDGVSSVKFSSAAPGFLFVSSWDKTASLYDVVSNQLRHRFAHPAPVLDCCFSDAVHGFSGGIDRKLRTFDFNTSVESVLGAHADAIRCVEYCHEIRAIVTGSWDKTMAFWDPRATTASSSQHPQTSTALPERVYTMDIAKDKIVVGMAGRHVCVFDVRNTSQPLQKTKSSLSHQTRVIRCFPGGEGYVTGSIEGRIAVEFFEASDDPQKKKYAFKCHRQNQDGVDTAFPVNAIAFHPSYPAFVSGGSDGFVSVWDRINKKRLRQWGPYPSSISSLSISGDGKYLAIAASYMYEQGEKDHAPDSIFIRPLSDADMKPKSLAA